MKPDAIALPTRGCRYMGGIARIVTVVVAVLLISTVSARLGMAAEGAAAKPITLVALGDSLTAGYGLPQPAAFPVQLAVALRKAGREVTVVNAGVSGDTASGGLERLDWAVPPETDGVILELGANDALRGIDPAKTRAALTEIVKRLKARNIEVMLAGMQAPRNLGDDYQKAFDSIYPALAKEYGLVLRPFFLEGVALDPKLTQEDRLHPTADGVAVIVAGILPSVMELISRIDAKRRG